MPNTDSRPLLARRFTTSAALYESLRMHPRHPVGRQLSRHNRRSRLVPVLPASLFCAILVFGAAAHNYTILSADIVWSLPLWLMLLSACPCVIWMARIVALLSRQSRAGRLDELSVIPAGRRFIFTTVCQVVLSESDAAWWLDLLRKVLAGIALLMLLMGLCVALAIVDRVDWYELASMLLDMLLLALAIPLESRQSGLLACSLGIFFGIRAPGALDRASAAFAVFALLQALSYIVAIAGAVLLNVPRLWLVCGLFLLLREIAIVMIWREVMRDS
ncbi:MAG: hypothetical protein OXE46_05395 [Chloroflexi bacterium]|nr:hypothetical protein [Chloroflexota bacterium]